MCPAFWTVSDTAKLVLLEYLAARKADSLYRGICERLQFISEFELEILVSALCDVGRVDLVPHLDRFLAKMGRKLYLGRTRDNEHHMIDEKCELRKELRNWFEPLDSFWSNFVMASARAGNVKVVKQLLRKGRTDTANAAKLLLQSKNVEAWKAAFEMGHLGALLPDVLMGSKPQKLSLCAEKFGVPAVAALVSSMSNARISPAISYELGRLGVQVPKRRQRVEREPTKIKRIWFAVAAEEPDHEAALALVFDTVEAGETFAGDALFSIIGKCEVELIETRGTQCTANFHVHPFRDSSSHAWC